jgi:hypothetical protein
MQFHVKMVSIAKHPLEAWNKYKAKRDVLKRYNLFLSKRHSNSNLSALKQPETSLRAIPTNIHSVLNKIITLINRK